MYKDVLGKDVCSCMQCNLCGVREKRKKRKVNIMRAGGRALRKFGLGYGAGILGRVRISFMQLVVILKPMAEDDMFSS